MGQSQPAVATVVVVARSAVSASGASLPTSWAFPSVPPCCATFGPAGGEPPNVVVTATIRPTKRTVAPSRTAEVALLVDSNLAMADSGRLVVDMTGGEDRIRMGAA